MESDDPARPPFPPGDGALPPDRYEIVRELGRSRYVVTRLATERSTGRIVAIKSLAMSGIDDEKVVELFVREAETLAESRIRACLASSRSCASRAPAGTGSKRDIGHEWDLIFIIEEWENLDLLISGAIFQAGSAYGSFSGKKAYYAGFEMTYRF